MILFCVLALAGRTSAAEAQRLSVEVSNLEARGAWSGVEKAYRRAVQTNEPLDVATHTAGARSALQQGDADLARMRLLLAYEAERSPEILDWLMTFSRDYSRLHLRVDPGVTLEIERRHFNPDHARIVDRAIEQLLLYQRFDGLLPLGRYRVGSFWFSIGPDGPDIIKDLRSCVTTAGGCPVDAVDPTVQHYVP